MRKVANANIAHAFVITHENTKIPGKAALFFMPIKLYTSNALAMR